MRSSARTLPLFYFVSFSAMGVFFPFLSTWLEARGITGLTLALASAIRPLAGILAPPLVGLAADHFGLRHSLLRTTAIGAATAFAALSVLSLRGELPLPLLLGLLALFSIFRAPMSALTDVTALESEGAYGRLRLWGSLGFLVAAGAIGYLIDLRATLPFPLVVAALLALTVAIALALPEPSRLPPQPVWSAARALVAAPDYQLFLAAVFTWLGSHSAYDVLLSLHLRDLGASSGFIGVAWAVGTLAEVALMLWYRPWLERHGAPRLMAVGVAVGCVRWALLAVVSTPTLVLLLQPLHAGSFALVFVAALEHVRQRAAPHVLATAQGLFAAAGATGAALSMFVWAPLYAATSGHTAFAVAAVVSLASLGAMLGLVTQSPRPLAIASE